MLTKSRYMAPQVVPPRRSAADLISNRITDNLERNVDSISNTDAINTLRMVLVVRRLASAAAVEDLRLQVVHCLMKHIVESGHKHHPRMLLAIVKELSQVGAIDLGFATGINPPANDISLVNVVSNKNANAAALMGSSAPAAIPGSGRTTRSVVKDIDALLEAIAGIADGVKRDPILLDSEVRTTLEADPSASR